MSAPTTFGDALRIERERLGYSPQRLAKGCGVSKACIAEWESNARRPRGTEMARLVGVIRRLAPYRNLANAPVAQAPSNGHNDTLDALAPKLLKALPAHGWHREQLLLGGATGARAAECRAALAVLIARGMVVRRGQEFARSAWAAKQPVTTSLGAKIAEAPGELSPTEVAAAIRARFGAAVRAEREALGISVGDFAQLLEVSASTAANWEHGRAAPSLDAYNRLIALLPELAPVTPPTLRNVRHPLAIAQRDEEPAHEYPSSPQPVEEEVVRETAAAPQSAPPREPSPIVAWTKLLLRLRADPARERVVNLLRVAQAAGMTIEDVLESLE